MTRSAWDEIGAFFNVVVGYGERLTADRRAQLERSRAGALLEGDSTRALRPAGGDTVVAGPQRLDASLVAIREDLRGRLKGLESSLARLLSEREKYFALFPIVIYVDEILRKQTQGRSDEWESLQSELYGVRDGGERFYTVLEELLRQEATHPLVFEIFYFCLNHGFAGQYSGEQGEDRRASILRELSARIPKADIPAPRAAPAAVAVRVRAFPWRYYALAAGGTLGVYAVLRLAGYASGGFQ